MQFSNRFKKYSLCLAVFVFLGATIIFALCNYCRKHLIKKYIFLKTQIFELEKEVITNRLLNLIDLPEDFKALGWQEKYFLSDITQKEKWMFKINGLKVHSYFGERLNSFMKICELATPEMFTYLLPLNNKYYFGTIQKVIPRSSSVKSIEDFKTKEHLGYLLNSEVISYLFNMKPEFILGNDGKIYAVDLDEFDVCPWISEIEAADFYEPFCYNSDLIDLKRIFNKKRVFSKCANYQEFLRKYFIKRSIKYNEEIIELVNFISDIPDDDFWNFSKCPNY